MQRISQNTLKFESELPNPFIIKTTLYDLVEAVMEEMSPNEGQVVPLVVSHMLGSDLIH
jgi:hypothetical protein